MATGQENILLDLRFYFLFTNIYETSAKQVVDSLQRSDFQELTLK